VSTLHLSPAPPGTTSLPGREPRRHFGIEMKHSLTGWTFLLPAAALIVVLNFYPMIQALLLSLHTGKGTVLRWATPLWYNYARLFQDPTFKLTIQNTFIYLIIQVPIMLILAMILATILNDKTVRFRGMWRTAIFLPCAVSLVSYSMVFRTMFSNNGMINDMLMGLHLTSAPINFLANTGTARMVIILGLLWRWTGYNMVFFLAGLQNIEESTFEAAKIDGAGPVKTFFFVTAPQLRPMIVLTAIMSINGTLQLFDESWNLTQGGPANTSMTMSHYLYQISFQNNPNIGYGSAVSYAILIMVAVLAFIQMRVGDKRD